MRKNFFHAISEIDPDLIDACERETTRRSHFKRPIAIAACLLFAITGILLIRIPQTVHRSIPRRMHQPATVLPKPLPRLLYPMHRLRWFGTPSCST